MGFGSTAIPRTGDGQSVGPPPHGPEGWDAMTEQKARKRQIRTRMQKTGERYTSARGNVVKPAQLPPRIAEPPFSEAAVRTATGKRWDDWFRILDAWGGTEHTHTEIARYVNQELGVDGWWAQSVTVGYERARGMRAPHQRTDGFSVDVSKTFPVDAEHLYRAFVDARQRNRWIERGTLALRTSTPAKRSARFDFGTGTKASRVIVSITPKGPTKATAAIQHERLSAAEDVETMRAFWKERFEDLKQIVAR